MTSCGVSALDIIFSIGSLSIKLIKCVDWAAGTIIAFFLRSRKNNAVKANKTIRTVLIIRPGGIGDALFILPILKFLKSADPHLDLDILCENRNRAVFKNQKNLFRKIFEYNHWSHVKSVLENQYDLVIDTEQWHYLSAILAYRVKAALRAGYNTRPLRKKLFEIPVNYKTDEYELENFRNIFEQAWGRPIPKQTLENSFDIPHEELAWASGQFTQDFVTLYIGASIPVRRLTTPQCIRIIQGALKKGYRIALIGGKDVIDAGAKIVNNYPDPKVRNFIGQTTFLQTAALIKSSRLFIGTDSGIMHLSCAVGTPTVALFGPGQLKKWAPQNSKHRVVTENVWCSPCTRFGYTVPVCRGQYQCMRTLNLDHIFDK